MKKITKILTISASLFAATACVGPQPEYKTSNSSMIVFKTPTVKYADQGFINRASSETKVEIYSNGQAVMSLRITPSQICMSSMECMDAKEFNRKILHAEYPADTLEHIFKGEKIFNGKGLQNLPSGFIQHIGSITYKVSNGNINFTDSSNGVKIKVVKI